LPVDFNPLRALFIFVGILALTVSCDPTGDYIPPARGAEYFPLKTGAFTIYDVDSIAIASNVETAYTYQLKLEVKGSFTNGAGGTSYIIQRQKRDNAGAPWTEAGTWSAWTDARNAVSVEGNQSFVKLQFPINVANAWNGNELNSNGGEDDCGGNPCDRYEVSEVDPDVLIVQGDVEDVLVKFDVRREVYSKDIGLTYKEVTVLEYCTSQNCFGNQFVDKGVKYTQTLAEHGEN
jgi:hypothetical protein